MIRTTVAIGVSIVAGVGAVYLLPPPWLAPLSTAAAICFAVFAIVVRIGTKTETSSSAVAGILLSVVNLPEQPFAKVKDGWALSLFLASAAFLLSLGLSVLVRASV